jgi:hypothetical protein
MSSIHSTFSGRPFRLYSGVAAAAVLFTTVTMSAQPAQAPAGTPQGSPANAGTANPARPAAQPAPAASQDQTASVVPAQPELPKWPVNETPSKPSVTWDSHGLRIEATNSSLRDILKEVSTDTGAKVEGLGTDERVFGEYGPGSARDVITQLLHGSSYNVLMIGDQGEGTPRQIVLSARKAPGPATANRQTPEQPDEDFVPDEPQADDQPIQPQQPPLINGRGPMMPPQGPPGAPRTPQQILQELQQRQQQIMEQQQQQQQQQQH